MKYYVIQESATSQSSNGKPEIIGAGGVYENGVFALAEADARNVLLGEGDRSRWTVYDDQGRPAELEVDDQEIRDVQAEMIGREIDNLVLG